MRIPTDKKEQLHRLVHWLLKHLTHLEYQDLEHIPASGPLIVATNHLSRVDIPGSSLIIRSVAILPPW